MGPLPRADRCGQLGPLLQHGEQPQIADVHCSAQAVEFGVG